MSALSKSVLLDWLRAVGLSLTLGAVVIAYPLLSVLSLLAVPLLPIPAAFVTSRHGIRLGSTVALITGPVALGLGFMAAGMGEPVYGMAASLTVFLLVALAGVGTGACLRAGISQARLYIYMSAFFLICLLAWMATVVAGVGVSGILQAFNDYAFESSSTAYLRLGVTEEQIADGKALAPYLTPALLLLLSVVFSGTCINLARRAFDRLRQPFPRDFVLREFRLHFGFAYVMIAGLLCQLGSPYLSESYQTWVSAAGTNLMLMSEMVFFVQGMAVASYFIWRYDIARIRKGAIYLLLVLLQLAFSLTSWIGLFDTWIDYRRRFDRKKA